MTRPTPADVAKLLALALFALGCGDDGDSSADAGDAGEGAADAALGADAGRCTPYEVAELCVLGTEDGGQSIVEGEPVRIRIWPEGCHSTGCTIVEEASCAADLVGETIEVEGGFCLRHEQPDGVVCTPDCAGAGHAECHPDEGLEAGDYTATLGELEVSFSVPSTLEPGGACDQLDDPD